MKRSERGRGSPAKGICYKEMDILLMLAGGLLTFVVLHAIIRKDEDNDVDWSAEIPRTYTYRS